MAFLVHTAMSGWPAVLVSLLLTVPLLRLLGWQGGLSTAVTISLMFMLIPHYTALNWDYVFNRTVDTSVGIVVALLTALLFWPKNRLQRIGALERQVHASLQAQLAALTAWALDRQTRPEPLSRAAFTARLLALEQLVQQEHAGHARHLLRQARWRQRLLGSLMGVAILLVCQSGLRLPLPLALGVALTLTRLLGCALGLQSGYKVAGFIVVMGWLVHSSNLSSWIPLRLGWTCLGIVVGLLAVRWIWPSRAIQQQNDGCRCLMGTIAAGLREEGQRLGSPLVPAASSGERRRRHSQDLAQLVALRQGRPAAITEPGLNPARQPLHHLWQLCDATFSLLLGTLDGLRSLPPSLLSPLALVELRMAEVRLLEAMAQGLEGWQTCRFAQDELLPRLAASGRETGVQSQALALAALRTCRELLHSPAFGQVPTVRQRQVARRLMLLEQADESLEAMDRRWQALQA